MRAPTALVLGAALLLAACGAGNSPMPNLDDEEDVAAATASLSPWQDGSPDRSRDGLTRGDPNSDRRVFERWVHRRANHEASTQHNRDYQPFTVPSTIAAALADQRAYEAEARMKSQAEEAAYRAQSARDDAEVARQAAQQARDQQERDRALDEVIARGKAEAEQQEAARVAAAAAETRQHAAEERQRRAADPGYRCRAERQEAADAAEAKQTTTGTGTFNRVWNSYHCP